ncbi:MAG: cyclopropane-fatty-acyl-phospholipid synthase [Gammaproteobacteria bacterium]|jgi:cyclopropane-fatty-acyl-phospholipid synthase
MKSSTVSTQSFGKKRLPTLVDNISRSSLFRVLNSLEGGTLTITEPEGTTRFGQDTEDDSTIHAHIFVKDPSFYRNVLFSGSIGAGESYVMDQWSSPDLTNVIRVISRNLKLLDKIEGGLSTASNLYQRFKHVLSRNSFSGSKRNIGAHYDLSNELFEYFLDSHMMYSSAIFPTNESNLEMASEHKLKTIAEKLKLTEHDHVLEIGTGWGGLAIYLAENYGCRVTTTTISKEQFEYASLRIKERNLGNLITLLDQDYRKLEGAFEKIVSIEMIEAVGVEYLKDYFRKCDQLLKPGGKMLLQAITIPEQRYDSYQKGSDFIQRYIFPGGSLPSIESILNNTGKHTSMQLQGLEDIGLDYAKTLAIWRDRFMSNPHKIHEMGFDDRFIRMWLFYLGYCEGGFLENAISSSQLLLRKNSH